MRGGQLRGGGGRGAVKHWYALFVFLHRQRHAMSLHEAISYLISTDTHGNRAPLLSILPPPSLYLFLSISSGASQLILHHFIFLFPRPGKWLTVPILPFWHGNPLSAVISQS